MKLIEILRAIAWTFQVNHEIARAKRRARKAGIDPEVDEEFRLANDLEVPSVQ
jgi:hypothetical protein